MTEQFTRRYGEAIRPREAAAILASVIHNGDTHPDLVTLTCELARSAHRAMTFAETIELCRSEGMAFDADGWVTES